MNWTIKNVIIALSAIGTVFSTILIAILGYEIHVIGVVKRQELEASYNLKIQTQQLGTHIVEIQQWLTDISATKGLDGLDDGFVEAEKSYNAAVKRIDWLRGNVPPDATAPLEKMPEDLDSFYNTGKKMAKLYLEQGVSSGNSFMGSFDRESLKLQQTLNSLVALVELSLEKSKKAIAASVDFAVTASLVLSVIAILVFFLVGSYFYRILSTQLKASLKQLNSSYQSLDEMASSMDENGSSLYGTVQMQSTNLQRSAAAMNEITAMVRKTSERAEDASGLSEKSLSASNDGMEKVKDMIASIGEIEESNDQIAKEMAASSQEMISLVEIISRINEKTQVISEIVFQTKLLSFNASVEAARAGEHGKGFSVVADEIGGLASMSGKASDEIRTLLENSTTHVIKTSDKTKIMVSTLLKSSKEKLDRGVSVANECYEAFDLILENVKESDSAVTEILLASKEQAIGVSEVNVALDSINHGSEKSSSISALISNLSKDLVMQVKNLLQAVVLIDKVMDGKTTSSQITAKEADC